jgi:hypothetical protein
VVCGQDGLIIAVLLFTCSSTFVVSRRQRQQEQTGIRIGAGFSLWVSTPGLGSSTQQHARKVRLKQYCHTAQLLLACTALLVYSMLMDD